MVLRRGCGGGAPASCSVPNAVDRSTSACSAASSRFSFHTLQNFSGVPTVPYFASFLLTARSTWP